MPVTLNTSTDPQVGFRPPGTLDMSSALQRYSGRFTTRNAAHLLRRAGFGGSATDIAALAAFASSDRAVDSLLHPTVADPDFPLYPPTDAMYDPKKNRNATQMWYLDRMLRTQRPLAEKMTLFWHGHFATSVDKVQPAQMAQQINLFRAQGLGTFRTLLSSVAKDPAMLIWLDNRSNVKAHPNENFAREVMELFALGLGNYTEDDVHNAARAFSGWGLDKTQQFVDRPNLHDTTDKTILGQTGNFNGDDVVNIIVRQPAHSRFIARKLLEFFVYSDPEPELVEGLADVYERSGANIGMTVGTIFRSNVFYSTRAYRAVPKSPIEFAIGTLRYMGVTTVPQNLVYSLQRMGQEPLRPPSVKGWDGGPTWINTSTLLARFNFVNSLVATTATQAQVAKGQAQMKPIGAMRAAPPAKPAPPPPLAAPNIQPDAIVALARGIDADRVIDVIVTTTLQDDVTSETRRTMYDFLTSSGGAALAGATSQVASVPFGPENYQEKIRGAFALAMNLPVNQLN